MKSQVTTQLLELLKRIDRPGTFCTSGCLPPAFPGLEASEVGAVALPLTKPQATALKKQARQAPYGKGTQTLVDTDVRRVWEIDADQVALTNPEWANVLKQVVSTVQVALGLERQQLDAHLYKLLLYEPGSFFLSHRDGEKLDRMVATLVIALPSAHEGGELIVRHEGREETVDFGPKSQFHAQFAAFYADCEHEIRPVTSGFRLALVYNLTLQKSTERITAPTSREHITAAAGVLRQWIRQQRTPPASIADSPPSKLAVFLDHQYTEAGLTYDALKGIDRAKADVLFAAAREAECDASLALATYWVSGAADEDYEYRKSRYGRRRGYRSSDVGSGEHSMGEIHESSLTVEHFSDAEGNPWAIGQIPLDEEEIVSQQPWKDGEPDKEDFEGYTGNAGMTLEHWYHRAAVMLWPAETRFSVLCEAGMEAAVGGLEQMSRQWRQAQESEQKALQQPCLEFASRIIAHWPERSYAGRYADFDGQDDANVNDDRSDDDHGGFAERSGKDDRAPSKARCHPLLSLLAELGDLSLIAAWLRCVLAKDAAVNPGTLLGDLCERHGWTTFQHELRELFESTTQETLERHAWLLADLARRQDQNADRKQLCAELARQIMSALERGTPQGTQRNWQARTVNRRELLPRLAQAHLALEAPALFERLVTYVLDRPKEYDLTTIQVPALLSLVTWLKRNVKHSSLPLHRWLTALRDELESRASHPPLEPTDWRRESATGCKCGDCKELSNFLQDPNRETLRLPLAKIRRQHLHQIIDGKQLDSTHVTEHLGRPYTLVCTKTNTSYERVLQAHQLDLDQLAKIRRLLDWHAGLSVSPPPPAKRPSSKKPKKVTP